MRTNFHDFFTVKFRNELRRKLKLKLVPSLKSVAPLPCENYVFNYSLFPVSLPHPLATHHPTRPDSLTDFGAI